MCLSNIYIYGYITTRRRLPCFKLTFVADVLSKRFSYRHLQVVTTSEAADKHLRAFEQGCEEWLSYHSQPVDESELQGYEAFVLSLLKDSETRPKSAALIHLQKENQRSTMIYIYITVIRSVSQCMRVI